MIRGEQGGGYGERRGRGKSRNMNRGLMGTDNSVGIDCGSSGGRAGESNWVGGVVGIGTTVTEKQLKKFLRRSFPGILMCSQACVPLGL